VIVSATDQPVPLSPAWDLRLVPAGVGSWIISIAVLTAPLSASALWVIVAILSTFSGIALLVLIRRSARHLRNPALLSAVTVLAMGGAGVSAVLYVLPEREGPLTEAVAAEVIATLDVVTEGAAEIRQPTVRGVRRGPPRVDVTARVLRIDSRLGEWHAEAPVILRLNADDPLAAAPVSLVPGTTLRVVGRLAGADYTPTAVAVIYAQLSVEVIAAPPLWREFVASIRTGLRDSVVGVPPDAGALVAGLAVGDESIQPPGLEEAMRVSGLSHLTAVSGGNIAIVLGAVILLGRLLGIPVVVRTIIGAFALLGYVLIVGPEPSVLRAAGMGTVAVLALVVGGPRRGLSALSATVVLLLILAPSLAVSLGFALSAAATAGLLVVSPGIRRWLHALAAHTRLPNRARGALADAIALTAAAQIATAPILASLGQGLSLVAVPANVLAAPAVAPVTVLGLLAAITAPVLPPLGAAFGHAAAPFAGWIAWWAHTFADWPGATLAWPGGLLGAATATGALVAAGMLGWVGRRRGWTWRSWRLRAVGVAVLTVAVLLVVAPPDRVGWPPPGWVAVACDVGQGDAFVIRSGEGRAVVVDAGPDPGLVDACLGDLGVEQVDLLVLSHFHADHVEGVPGVLGRRSVGRVLVSPVAEPVEQAERVIGWLDEAGLVPEVARTGDVGSVGDEDAGGSTVTWQVLWPARVIREGSIPNNASVVLDVRVGGVRMLLLGDVEPAAQVALRGARGEQAFDVVKVAHHGSRYQDPRLASWTSGRVAVISAGADNDYGHPAAETLASWEAVGARVMRTDVHGAVAVVVRDGQLGVVTRR
jgi:competence protein ComEC